MAKTKSKPAAKAKPVAKAKPAANSKSAKSKPAAKPASKPAMSKPAAKSKPASAAKSMPAPASNAAPASKPAPATSNGNADKLWDAYCANPADRELLRVYADALGGPRGDFINLCLVDNPTAEQTAAKEALLKKQKKILAGPAGDFVREFEFGPLGLVARARTEAAQVLAGGATWRTMNPRLVLTITSLKTQKDAAAFAKADLSSIWFVDFGWITGTHGGMRMSDKVFETMAPALAPVRHLQLSARGAAENVFSPETLRRVSPHLQALRYLAIDYYAGDGLAPAEEYIAAVRETLPNLRAFDFTDLPGPGLLDGGSLGDATDEPHARGRGFAELLEAALA